MISLASVFPKSGVKEGACIPITVLANEKIIFLNEGNLNKLRAYKAFALDKSEFGEVHIVLTGFSKKEAKALFNSLVAMKREEVTHARNSFI